MYVNMDSKLLFQLRVTLHNKAYFPLRLFNISLLDVSLTTGKTG